MPAPAALVISNPRLFTIRLLLCVMLCATACTVKPRRSFLPDIPGYDERKKELIILDPALLEISGMHYLDDGRIAANNDEDGKIFFFDSTGGPPQSLDFGDKGDYEDIVKVDSNFYVLESNGRVHRVHAQNPADRESFDFHKKKKIEFESIYFDSSRNCLVMLSKDHGEKKVGIIAYSFDLQTHRFSGKPFYSIPMRQIFMALKNNIAECKPSAAAVHPRTNHLFIIASIGKAILQCDLNGRIIRAYKINPAQFPQPEGITFAPNGDMYISNEGLNGKATVLRFPYDENRAGLAKTKT